jgi:hypothetical protein
MQKVESLVDDSDGWRVAQLAVCLACLMVECLVVVKEFLWVVAWALRWEQ